MQSTSRSFLGVKLIESRLDNPPAEVSNAAVYASLESHRCRRLVVELIERAAVLAGVAGNLVRLAAEYRRTERRARALEDVILPEIEGTLRDVESHFEEVDQEEARRSRLHYGSKL